MWHLRMVVLLAALLGLPSLSFGQTIFDVTGNLTIANGALAGTTVGSFSGTIEINTTTGDIVSWNILMPSIPAYPGSAAVGAFTFSPSDSTAGFSASLFGGPGYIAISAPEYRLNFELLNANGHSLVGFNGATLSGGPNGSDYIPLSSGEGFAINGTVEPSQIAVTPEPSTFVLMGSGLLAVLTFQGRLWRKSRRPRSTSAVPSTSRNSKLVDLVS
jgi:PEP-CTERM motif